MKTTKNQRLAMLVLCLFAVISAPKNADAQTGCGELANAYGPFDYRTQKKNLEIVEGAHFLPIVENLIRGTTTSSPGGDIDYTLRASPNHHRALLALMRLAKREKQDKPKGSRYTVACWLERAVRFAPDDAKVQMLYGTFLIQHARVAEGVKKLEEALESVGENANIYYNLGLAYADLKEYDKALASAHKAYRLGFDLPGLRKKLEKAGMWRDPESYEPPTEELPVKQKPIAAGSEDAKVAD